MAEAALIVLSVLLAFWINAWWEGRQARTAEAAAVEAVRAELERNRSGLEVRIDQNRRQLVALERFLGMAPRALGAIPPDSVRLFAAAMVIPPTFDPEMAAATVLARNAVLTSPRDVEVRHLVAR
jgi:transposase-like protein